MWVAWVSVCCFGLLCGERMRVLGFEHNVVGWVLVLGLGFGGLFCGGVWVGVGLLVVAGFVG